MSQNPNGGNYNPYNPNPSNPQYPPAPDTAYGAPPPPSGPNPGYQQPPSGPNPYANPNTPNSSYGPYNPMSAPPPPGYTPPSTPMPPAIEPNPYDPYAQTVMSQRPSAPAYPGYNPPSGPGGIGMPTMPPASMAPSPRRGRGMVMLISVIILILVVGGSAIGLVAYNTNQNTLHANATATAQANANAQATATAVASTYPFSNKLLLNDPLVDNSKGVKWDNDKANGCFFSGSAYHAIDSQKNTYNTCAANSSDYTDFTFQVEMVIKSGQNEAGGGLIFRADNTNFKFYRLYIDDQGNYGILVSVDSTGTNGNARDLKEGVASQFLTGLEQTNTIAVVVRGDQIAFYVNQQLVTTITDSTYTHGQVGVLAQNLNGGTTEVVYTNAKVWQLP